MHYCENCGSTSQDNAGFCRGCGAHLPRIAPSESLGGQTAKPTANVANERLRSFASTPLAQPQVKNVWVAVLLALLLGPVGMMYSTIVGTLVMTAATVFALFLPNKIVVWIVFCFLPVVCAVWAGLAARSANSMY
jgi:hypothetical protein